MWHTVRHIVVNVMLMNRHEWSERGWMGGIEWEKREVYLLIFLFHKYIYIYVGTYNISHSSIMSCVVGFAWCMRAYARIFTCANAFLFFFCFCFRNTAPFRFFFFFFVFLPYTLVLGAHTRARRRKHILGLSWVLLPPLRSSNAPFPWCYYRPCLVVCCRILLYFLFVGLIFIFFSFTSLLFTVTPFNFSFFLSSFVNRFG